MKKQHPLRRWREDQGVLQNDVAIYLGLSPAFICMIEKGDRGVSMQTAVKLSKFTGLPLEAFVREPA